MNSRSNIVNIIRFKTQAINSLTTTNYANVAYDSLTYNMASATLTIESNSKSRHCHPMYGVAGYIRVPWLFWELSRSHVGWTVSKSRTENQEGNSTEYELTPRSLKT